jgi:tape measure domain-containing protein
MAAQIKITASEEKFIASMKAMSGAVGELTARFNIGLNRELRHTDGLSRQLDRGFGALGDRFKSFGTAMSIGVTLPLALAAKSASDAFAEYDSLRRGLATLYPTIDGLNGRLASMRELAKLPGLGFQEAIQGDIRLQSVGIAAAQSTRILREFSNAVALTGGGKEKLNEVTIQLGQMAAKGKVLNQDLRPIIESAPMVSQALQRLFGTVSSEDISKSLEDSGKSSVDFINMLLGEMEKAPRVTGGWKNALENMTDTLFIAKAQMFEVAEATFNLSERMNGAATFVENLVASFVGLPKPLQAAIIGATGFLILLGPMSFALGGLISFIPKLIAGLYSVQIAAGAATLGIGLLVGVIISLIGQQQEYNALIKSSETAHTEATASVDKESQTLNGYITVLKSATSTLEQKKAAKAALINISPAFSSVLDGEKTDFDKLKKASYAYLQSLYDIEKHKKMIASRDKVISKMESASNGDIMSAKGVGLGLLDVVVGFADMRNFEDGKIIGNFKNGVNRANADLLTGLATTLAGLDAELAEGMGKILQAQGSIEPNPLGGGKPDDAAAKAIAAKKKELERIETAHDKNLADYAKRRAIAERNAIFGSLDAIQISGFQDFNLSSNFAPDKLKGLTDLKESLTETLGGIFDVDSATDKMYEHLDEFMKNVSDYKPKKSLEIEEIKKEFARYEKIFGTDARVFGASIVGDLTEGLVSGGGFGGALKGLLLGLGNMVSDYGKQLLRTAILIKGAKSIFNINPGSDAAIGKAIGLIAAGGLFRGISNNIPKLARGGVSTNPVMAMIGDNASGKEMVLPFERNNEFADAIANRIGGGGGMNLTHSIQVKGQDLLIVLERAKKAL